MNVKALFFIFLTVFLSCTIFIAWMHHSYTSLPTVKSSSSRSSFYSSSSSLGTQISEIQHDHKSKDVSIQSDKKGKEYISHKSPSSSSSMDNTTSPEILHNHSSIDVRNQSDENEKKYTHSHPPSPIMEAHLSCESYGGPDDDVAQKMVYWSDIPKDAQFVSPYKKLNTPQYLVFEPDVSMLLNVTFLYG